MTIDVQRLITNLSLTHHDHRFSLTYHRLITDSSSTHHGFSPTHLWFSPNHHRLIADSSPTHHQFITDSSPTHHPDSSLKHNDHWFTPTYHILQRLIIDASWTSIYTDLSHSAATTFCSDDILQRRHSAATYSEPMTFCTDDILHRRHSAININ